MSTRIIKTLRNVTFGEGGPYKLLRQADNPHLHRAAWDYLQRVATLAEYRRVRAETIVNGLGTEHVDSHITAAEEGLVLAKASATRAFYANGFRWHLVVVGGWYCYLAPGVDRNGDHYEPYPIAGPVDGVVQCPGCQGCGKQVYNRALGAQTCFGCKGVGRIEVELPETVRRCIEAEAAKAEREMAHAFTPAEEEVALVD